MTDLTQILNVLAHYARAHDQRDAEAMSVLFADDAVIEIFNASGQSLIPIGTLQGQTEIFNAVSQMMAPHGQGAWSQNVINAPIVEIDGDEAVVDAQFMVFSLIAAPQPNGGWPAGSFGAQGTIVPIEAGQYHKLLRRSEAGWKITAMRIEHRIPMAFD